MIESTEFGPQPYRCDVALRGEVTFRFACSLCDGMVNGGAAGEGGVVRAIDVRCDQCGALFTVEVSCSEWVARRAAVLDGRVRDDPKSTTLP